jgi:general secretion pathway protein C
MTLWIRKYFWTINLVTIALCALFAAMAVGRIVEANLPPVKARRAASAPTLPSTIASPQDRDIKPILARNIFCSTCEPIEPTEPNPADPSAEPASNEPVKTSLNLKLIATLVSHDQAWSFAAIEDTGKEATRMYGIGTSISDGVVVTDIMTRRVLLQNGSRNEYLDLEDGEATQSSIEQNVPPRPTMGFHTPSPVPGMEEVSKGIRKVGEGKYEIQRSALNRVLANTTMLARSARIVPSVRNGKPNGFKLYAIRPGSLYSLLGMFNGDTINAINGHPITTPDKALEVYTKLRSASHVTISFTRRGTPVSHEYNIR